MTSTIISSSSHPTVGIPIAVQELPIACMLHVKLEYRGRHQENVTGSLVRFPPLPYRFPLCAYICPSFRRSISLPLQLNRTSYVALPLHSKLSATTRVAIKHHRSRSSANMSGTKMPASHGHSEACCNIPPIVVEGYEPKGKYETINGMKTCVSNS